MLGKLIKHDFRSLSRVLLPTQLAILGATILATIGFAVNLKMDYSHVQINGVLSLIRVITGLLSGIMVVAIIAASILVAFIIFQRFYKNLISDEGYLTFTLPVTTTNILWSKLITAMIWTLISSAVIFVCLNIFVLFGTGNDGFVNLDAYRAIGEALNAVNTAIGARVIWPILEIILFILIAAANNILQIYLALIIGGVVSHKHKVLAGIGFYFAINFAVSMLMSIIQFLFSGSMLNSFNNLNGIQWENKNALEIYNHLFGAIQPYYWFYLGLILALTVGYFLLSRYLLKNKLNLE